MVWNDLTLDEGVMTTYQASQTLDTRTHPHPSYPTGKRSNPFKRDWLYRVKVWLVVHSKARYLPDGSGRLAKTLLHLDIDQMPASATPIEGVYKNKGGVRMANSVQLISTQRHMF